MTPDEIIEFTAALPGVVANTPDETSEGPEIARGDTFFHHGAAKMPFATIVTKDYPGFDTASDLDRPGVFRLNIGVGRTRFEALLGHAPAAQAEHAAEFDYTALDRLLPHPAYAVQSWVSILNPGPNTDELVRQLIVEAHRRAAR